MLNCQYSLLLQCRVFAAAVQNVLWKQEMLKHVLHADVSSFTHVHQIMRHLHTNGLFWYGSLAWFTVLRAEMGNVWRVPSCDHHTRGSLYWRHDRNIKKLLQQYSKFAIQIEDTKPPSRNVVQHNTGSQMRPYYRIRWLCHGSIAGISLRKPGFGSKPVHVGFVVDEVELRFSPTTSVF
jgi:hypothetical protein